MGSPHCVTPPECYVTLWHGSTNFIYLGDLTGRVLAYFSLLPIAILVGFVTLIVFKRELHTVSSAHFGTMSTIKTGPWRCQRQTGFIVVVHRFVVQISFFGGLILNEGVNWLFKNILREPRPCAGKWKVRPSFGNSTLVLEAVSKNEWFSFSASNKKIKSLENGGKNVYEPPLIFRMRSPAFKVRAPNAIVGLPVCRLHSSAEGSVFWFWMFSIL